MRTLNKTRAHRKKNHQRNYLLLVAKNDTATIIFFSSNK